MSAITWIRLGAVLGFLAVAAGAFGAHGLKSMLEPELKREAESQAAAADSTTVPTGSARVPALRRIEVFETGVRYHFWHVLALLALGLLMLNSGRAGTLEQVAGAAFVAGIVLFSGSLYLLGLTGLRWLGIVPVLGGISFMVGWIALALCAGRGGNP